MTEVMLMTWILEKEFEYHPTEGFIGVRSRKLVSLHMNETSAINAAYAQINIGVLVRYTQDRRAIHETMFARIMTTCKDGIATVTDGGDNTFIISEQRVLP